MAPGSDAHRHCANPADTPADIDAPEMRWLAETVASYETEILAFPPTPPHDRAHRTRQPTLQEACGVGHRAP